MDLDALAILPDLLSFVGREEGLDLPDVEEAADGLFALGHGVESEPAKGLWRGFANKWWSADEVGNGLRQ